MLKLHRIIHPEDVKSNGPRPGMKKPYLLLHGLIGSSASFVRNIDLKYQAPGSVFNLRKHVRQSFNSSSNSLLYPWQSTAEKFHGSSDIEKRTIEQALHNKRTKRQFASINEVDFDADTNSFGRDFKQAYRGFTMPYDSKDFITNSLAFTLSNFNYDVFLINLRGNYYSKEFKGRYTADDAEYWNFNIDTIVKEDLLAVTNFVKSETQFSSAMGFISYSFSSLHVLGLLSKFSDYQETLQPVVMIAPTLLNPTGQSSRSKLFIRTVSNFLVAHNGPWPAAGRSKHGKLERLICQLPVTSSLCSLLEIVLYRRAKPENIPRLLLPNYKAKLLKKDTSCGQTSAAVLHQIVDNLSGENINPKFVPFVQARNRQMKGRGVRRSVMLIHSKDDKISTSQDIDKIRDKALKTMVLTDVVIKEPNFDHTDFLFGKANQYLVNAEIVRMVSVFDYMTDHPAAPPQPNHQQPARAQPQQSRLSNHQLENDKRQGQ